MKTNNSCFNEVCDTLATGAKPNANELKLRACEDLKAAADAMEASYPEFAKIATEILVGLTNKIAGIKDNVAPYRPIGTSESVCIECGEHYDRLAAKFAPKGTCRDCDEQHMQEVSKTLNEDVINKDLESDFSPFMSLDTDLSNSDVIGFVSTDSPEYFTTEKELNKFIDFINDILPQANDYKYNVKPVKGFRGFMVESNMSKDDMKKVMESYYTYTGAGDI